MSRCVGTTSNCSVRDNVASLGGFGECGGAIEDCTVCDNLAESFGGGFSMCEGSAVGCTINRNRSGCVGGGVEDGREGELVNCTIAEKWAAAHALN